MRLYGKTLMVLLVLVGFIFAQEPQQQQEMNLNQLEIDTFNKIKDGLSSLRGIQFLQIQRQIDTIVKLQISAQFPLLK